MKRQMQDREVLEPPGYRRGSANGTSSEGARCQVSGGRLQFRGGVRGGVRLSSHPGVGSTLSFQPSPLHYAHSSFLPPIPIIQATGTTSHSPHPTVFLPRMPFPCTFTPAH